MPNKEEKKYLLKKKRDSAFKKSVKEELHSNLKKDKRILSSDNEILSTTHSFSTTNCSNLPRLQEVNDSLSFNNNSIHNSNDDSYLQRFSNFGTHCGKKISNCNQYSKRRCSKPNSTKFFFFPFLKKSTDSNNTIQSRDGISSKLTSKFNQMHLSAGDSSQCSINSEFNSGNSLFSASQYLYSSNALNYASSNGLNPNSALNSRRLSFLNQDIYSCYNENLHLRPNSIAFPLTPLPKSTINLPTSQESSVRHSIATMPQHLPDSTHCSHHINPSKIFKTHFTDKCISSPSLENSELWSPIIPSHPDYPKMANDMMHCSKSLTKDFGCFLSDDLKRQSLPSDGDSGVAFDHHKQSLVFSGYNGLLSIDNPNHDLSRSTHFDYEFVANGESSYSSNEFTSKDRENHFDLFHFPKSIKLSSTDSDCFIESHPILLQSEYFTSMQNQAYNSNDNFDNFVGNALFQKEMSSIGRLGSFSTSLQDVSLNSQHHFVNQPLTLQTNLSQVSCYQRNKFDGFNCQESSRQAPRRTKSLKDYNKNSSNRALLPLENFLTHERDVSFYTYIAPDPNHAKEIPLWLEQYTPEDSTIQFNWNECKVDDLLCWNTLLGRLYKKELEGIIQLYEDCRENLILIINERREDLVGERIALENALMSEEAYV